MIHQSKIRPPSNSPSFESSKEFKNLVSRVSRRSSISEYRRTVRTRSGFQTAVGSNRGPDDTFRILNILPPLLTWHLVRSKRALESVNAFVVAIRAPACVRACVRAWIQVSEVIPSVCSYICCVYIGVVKPGTRGTRNVNR